MPSKQVVNIRTNDGATLRRTNDQNGSSTPRSRSRFRKRHFRVTTLATLISDPDRSDLRHAVSWLLLQRRNLGPCG